MTVNILQIILIALDGSVKFFFNLKLFQFTVMNL